MKKRIFSLAVSILMTIALIPQGAVMVMAQDDFTIEQIQEETQQAENAAEPDAVLRAAAGMEAPKQYTEITEDTWNMTTGIYRVTRDVKIESSKADNGLRVEKGAKVLLYIDEGKTLTVIGRGPIGVICPGYAGILLPEGSTLTVAGKGTLNATGGDGGNGLGGNDAYDSKITDKFVEVGYGGRNDWYPHGNYMELAAGGCGAGAGIGTDGGYGGVGGAGGELHYAATDSDSNKYGNEGGAGTPGTAAEPAGTLIVTGSVTVNAQGGKAGQGGRGGDWGSYAEKKFTWTGVSAGTSGGGGGGGGGGAADGIGCGGSGGGGGGGGASANVDGERALFGACDLDDLWGHGGEGGASWDGNPGERGREGSNGGDDTSASRKYAKAGGAGGASPARKTVAFYTYKSSASDNPTVNCTTGSGVTRSATSLGSLQEFMSKGGSLVSSGTALYDGNQHGVSVDGSNKLSTQEANVLLAQEGGDWPDSGTVTIDGFDVSYSIAYYDEAGSKLETAPVMPGQYAAVVTFTSEKAEYCGDWVETFTIAKKQVEKPTPRALVFECGNWYTGEGAQQDAFQGLEETDYKFVPNKKAADGTTSLRSAKAAGSYQACFRLKDPETCAWAGEPDDAAEVWVPWSIALQEFDANDSEITYWGTAYDNTVTTVENTGEPVWVRPWYTYARGTDGKYPEWFTHWGSKDRPTTDRRSSAVFYMKGVNDREGLVGYHTNADGILDLVTAEQVYAWVNGVDIDGEHKPVQSGDKVWYKTGDDGWKVPLAVGETGPEGAEGYVIARDYAYADKLGVKDPGIYQAYAWFDDGAGFASTSLAEATVEVRGTISDAKVTGIKDKTYTGKKLTQSKLKVVLDGKTLVNGKDYKVTYTDNTNAGTAKVEITGINEQDGMIIKTFKIAKATQKVKAVTPKNDATKKLAVGKSFMIKATASKEQGTAQFKKVSGNKKLKISSTGKVTAEKGLKKGKTYTLKYKVRIKATENCKTTKYVTRTVKIKISK